MADEEPGERAARDFLENRGYTVKRSIPPKPNIKWPDFEASTLGTTQFVVEVKEIKIVGDLTKDTALQVGYNWEDVYDALEDDFRLASKQLQHLDLEPALKELPRVLWLVTELPLLPDDILVGLMGVLRGPDETLHDVHPNYRGRHIQKYVAACDLVVFHPLQFGHPPEVFIGPRRPKDDLVIMTWAALMMAHGQEWIEARRKHFGK